MNRKDTLKALLRPDLTSVQPHPQSTTVTQAEDRVAAGSIRAMGLSLQRLTTDAQDAHALREQIGSGATVIDVDPELVDPSFVADRLSPADDQTFKQLVDSI